MGRVSAAKRRLSAPRSLKTSSVSATAVTLKWTAPKGAKPAYYVVLRDGKAIAKTTRPTYTDRKVKVGKTYRYSVRAYDKGKKARRAVRERAREGPEAPARRRRRRTRSPPIAPVAAAAPGAAAPDPSHARSRRRTPIRRRPRTASCR